jgi:DNA-binding protein
MSTTTTTITTADVPRQPTDARVTRPGRKSVLRDTAAAAGHESSNTNKRASPKQRIHREVGSSAAAERGAADNEIRVAASRGQRSYVAYAAAVLTGAEGKVQHDSVVISGMGAAMNIAANVAESVKHRVPGLHQITEVSTQKIAAGSSSAEVDATAESVKNESPARERKVPTIRIVLSLRPLDEKHYGYQPPTPAAGPHAPEGPAVPPLNKREKLHKDSAASAASIHREGKKETAAAVGAASEKVIVSANNNNNNKRTSDKQRVHRETNSPTIRSAADNEIRVAASRGQRSYVAYAAAVLTGAEGKVQHDSVVISGMGAAMNIAANVAESVKHRVPGLHQITEVSTQKIAAGSSSAEVDAAVTTAESGKNESPARERKVPTIRIVLSLRPLDEKHYGYQPPTPAARPHPAPGTVEPLHESRPASTRTRHFKTSTTAAAAAAHGAGSNSGVRGGRGRGSGGVVAAVRSSSKASSSASRNGRGGRGGRNGHASQSTKAGGAPRDATARGARQRGGYQS